MATVKGVNKTLIDASTRLTPGQIDARTKCNVDTYEASALAVADIIQMSGRLTKGARVQHVILAYDGLGASITLDVGDAEDTTRYLSGIDVSSAGSTLSNRIDGMDYETNETDTSNLDTEIIITVGGSGTATGTIKLLVFYTND